MTSDAQPKYAISYTVPELDRVHEDWLITWMLDWFEHLSVEEITVTRSDHERLTAVHVAVVLENEPESEERPTPLLDRLDRELARLDGSVAFSRVVATD